MVDPQKLIPRQGVCKIMEQAHEQGQIVYMGAPYGYGKSCAVREWAERKRLSALWIQAGASDFMDKLRGCEKSLIILDNLHDLPEEDEAALCDYLAKNWDHHYILMGRSPMPPWLRPFDIAGTVVKVGPEQLSLDSRECYVLFSLYGLEATGEDAEKLRKLCHGYPLSATLILTRVQRGEPLSASTQERSAIDLFHSYEHFIFDRWDSEVQGLLMRMAGFEEFTSSLATMVTGWRNAQKIIERILASSACIVEVGFERYRFYYVFKDFLAWEQRRTRSDEFIRGNFHSAGLYFELQGDLPNALFYYDKAGNRDKVSELLIENARRHPGTGQYYETERYYRRLPRETLLSSPELMGHMSMLCSLYMNVEESEHWYKELEQYAATQPRDSTAYKKAAGTLAWLRVSLPHLGSRHMAAMIMDAASLAHKRGYYLPEFTITTNLPSIIDGGKDLSRWGRSGGQLYNILREPLNQLLGATSRGLLDLGMAETLYECNGEYSECMLLVNRGLIDAANGGSPEVEFAGTDILCRIVIAQGAMPLAVSTREAFHTRARENDWKTLLPNLEAEKARHALLRGDLAEVNHWLDAFAPDETKEFKILDRYQYMTKVRCYLLKEKYAEALSLLSRLTAFAQHYDRTIVEMESRMLLAMLLYRSGQEGWRNAMEQALELAAGLDYVRIFADEGAALLELLQKTADPENPYHQRILEATRRQARLYPDYLQSGSREMIEALTETEHNVLQLLARGLKNDEIAEALGIKVSTVKSHTGNLYGKLKVKSRVQAVNMGQKYGLI